MRILVLAQYFPPDMGGGATRAYNVAKGLSLVGCEVVVVTAVPHYPTGNIPKKYRRRLMSMEYEGNFEVIRTFVPPLASKGLARRILLFSSFALSSLLGLPYVGRIDVVWAANPNIIAVFPSFLYKKVKRCPLVQNVDDLWPESLYDLGMSKKSFLARIAGFVARTSYKLASAITPISPAYVPIIKNNYQIDSRKVHVVPAGIDLDKFPLEDSRDPKRSGKFTVLYIGAFSPAYNFDQIFSAAELLSSHFDIQFVIQGGGELAPALKSMVKEMKLANVSVIDKIVSRDEVARTLAEADVLLLPLSGTGSIEMGISSKLYEYQASGGPIICCSSGQSGRYVSGTKCGIVVKPGDFEALSKSILYLKEHASIARKMGESGRRYVERNMSLEKIGANMKKLLESAKLAGRRQ